MQRSLKPVQVVTEDEREFTFLSLGPSSSGIRLIGLCGLLGQKVRVRIPNPDGAPWCFVVRILWTCRVGDDLIENGGACCQASSKRSMMLASIAEGGETDSDCVSWDGHMGAS
jgi:hypothetical protein